MSVAPGLSLPDTTAACGGRSGGAGQSYSINRKGKHEGASWTAIAATVLILGGAFLFTAGAVLVAWPVWAAGLALFAGGFILYRP